MTIVQEGAGTPVAPTDDDLRASDLLHLVSEWVHNGLPMPFEFSVQGGGHGYGAENGTRILCLNFQSGADLELWAPKFECSRHRYTASPSGDCVVVTVNASSFYGWHVGLTAYDKTGEYLDRVVSKPATASVTA